jgi:hypothetical protein
MKKEEKLKEERLAELLSKADGHPMMKAILAEEAAAILAKRTEAAGKIEALKKEREEVIPHLQADIEMKEAKYLKAKVALDVLFDELRTAKAELFSEGFQFDNTIRQHEAVLYETTDPALNTAITFFMEKFDDLRKPGRISSRGMTVENNLIADTKTLTTETNKNAVLGALAYCQAAIKLLEALKLSPEFHVEEIQGFLDRIPSIDEYQEVSGKKPFWQRVVNPRDLLKSDSQLDWEMGKLNEKFKKVMRK